MTPKKIKEAAKLKEVTRRRELTKVEPATLLALFERAASRFPFYLAPRRTAATCMFVAVKAVDALDNSGYFEMSPTEAETIRVYLSLALNGDALQAL